MSFFNFLSELGYAPQGVERMQLRWDHIIKPFAAEIEGARVLDLAAHDGRWSYAFAGAGAREVVAVEGRAALVRKYAKFPNTPFKSRVSLTAGDLFPFCRDFVARKEAFDVVAILGVFYHIMGHYELLLLVSQLKPKIIIVDSTFLDVPQSIIRVQREPAHDEKVLNAIAAYEGQKVAPVGIVSLPAFAVMVEAIGYTMKQVSWSDVKDGLKSAARDYFRLRPNRRFTFALRPA